MDRYEVKYLAHKHMITIQKDGIGVTLTLMNNVGPKTAEFLTALVEQANAVAPRPTFIDDYIVYIVPEEANMVYYFYQGTHFAGRVVKSLEGMYQTYLPGVDPLPDILKELKELNEVKHASEA